MALNDAQRNLLSKYFSDDDIYGAYGEVGQKKLKDSFHQIKQTHAAEFKGKRIGDATFASYVNERNAFMEQAENALYDADESIKSIYRKTRPKVAPNQGFSKQFHAATDAILSDLEDPLYDTGEAAIFEKQLAGQKTAAVDMSRGSAGVNAAEGQQRLNNVTLSTQQQHKMAKKMYLAQHASDAANGIPSAATSIPTSERLYDAKAYLKQNFNIPGFHSKQSLKAKFAEAGQEALDQAGVTDRVQNAAIKSFQKEAQQIRHRYNSEDVTEIKSAYQKVAGGYLDNRLRVTGSSTKESYMNALKDIGITDVNFDNVNDFRKAAEKAIEEKSEWVSKNVSHNTGTKLINMQYDSNTKVFDQMNNQMDLLSQASKSADRKADKVRSLFARRNGYDAATTAARKEVQAATHAGIPGKMGWKGRAAIFTVAALATTAVAGMMFAGGKRDNAQLYNPNAAFQYA